MPAPQCSKCCLSVIWDLRFWSSILDPWFIWTGVGIFLGFGVQWKLIHEAYFSDSRTPVEVIVGILLFGFALNFVVIGTAFAMRCGALLRSRAFIAIFIRNFPGLQHLVQVPSKILVGVWLSAAVVKTWNKLSKWVECMDRDECEGLFGTLMDVRDKICLYEMEHDGMEEVERSFFETMVTEMRESEFCQEIFYFFPFGFVFVLTTFVAAFVFRVHLMKQERLRVRDYKANLESTASEEPEGEHSSKVDVKKSETEKPITPPEPVVKAKKPKFEDETQLVETNSEPKPKAAKID